MIDNNQENQSEDERIEMIKEAVSNIQGGNQELDFDKEVERLTKEVWSD